MMIMRCKVRMIVMVVLVVVVVVVVVLQVSALAADRLTQLVGHVRRRRMQLKVVMKR